MRIKEILIKNFNGIAERTIHPEKITAFLGPCGTGKSSTLDAIRFALTGKAEQEDIKKGAKEASVTITFEDGTVIQRIRTKDGTTVKCNNKRASAKAVNEFFLNLFGIDPAAFEAMCGTDYFEGISQKDITAFFLSILPVQINFSRICQLATTYLKRKLTATQVSLLSKAFLDRDLTREELDQLDQQYPQDDTIFGLEDIEKVYQKLFEQRKLQKQTVKVLTARAQFEKTLPKESKEDLEKEVYNIAKAGAQAEFRAKELRVYNQAIKQREEAEKKQKMLTESLKSYDSVAKPDPKSKDQAIEDRGKFQNAIKTCQGSISAFQTNNQLFEKTLQSLTKPICPISEKLRCTTDKTQLKDELIQTIRKNQEEIKKNQAFIARCEEQVKMRDKIIQEYDDMNLKYLQKESILKQIAAIVLPDIPAKPKEEPAVDYESKKRELNGKIAIWTEYEGYLANKKQLEAEQKSLSDLELCVSLFAVKQGIRPMIIQKVLTPFETMLNEKAANIRKDFQVKFLCEDGIEIYVAPRSGTGLLSMQKVSTGEFVFVAYLLMSVVNELTNVGIIMIDSVDKLDEQYLTVLLDLLENDSKIDHVFMGGVNHPDTIEAMKNKVQIIM